MKQSQILRKAAKGRCLAEILILLEPIKKFETGHIVGSFIIDEVVNYVKDKKLNIRLQNEYCRGLLIACAKKYEEHGN